MNNVSHGVAALRDGREGTEGRKRKLELDTHRIMKAAIYGRERGVREKEEPSKEGAVRKRTYATENKYFTEYRFSHVSREFL